MCNKICFTKVEAQSFLNTITHRKQYRKEQRKYYCGKCKAWHVTSQPQRDETLDIPIQFVDDWQKLIINEQ